MDAIRQGDRKVVANYTKNPDFERSSGVRLLLHCCASYSGVGQYGNGYLSEGKEREGSYVVPPMPTQPYSRDFLYVEGKLD